MVHTSPSARGPLVNLYTEQARTHWRKHSEQLLPPVALQNAPPTPEQLDLEERLDRAVLISTRLLEQARDILSVLCLAQDEVDVTYSENAEKQNALAWTRSYEIANTTNDSWLNEIERLSREIWENIEPMQTGYSNATEYFRDDVDSVSLSPIGNDFQMPPQARDWFRGSYDFREYRDDSFQAEQMAHRQTLGRAPRVSRSYTATSMEIPTTPPRRIPQQREGSPALIPSIKRMYTTAQQSLARAQLSPQRLQSWQSTFKIDRKS